MARAIDRESLLRELTCDFTGTPFHGNRKVTIGEVRRIIESMPTLAQPNEWVSVKDKLPTDEHPVLVFVGYADTMTGFITTSSYFCFDENPHWQWDGLVRDEQRTLFWMPLPEPPDRRPPEGEVDT